jgi:predicted O-methyltransferase YrrM
MPKGLEDVAVYPDQGRFLALQASITGFVNILEIGTLGAYSTVWFASASPRTKVTSIEVDPHAFSVAQENLILAGKAISDRITLHLGHALDILPRLRSEIQSSNLEPFDFVFIDADKENNVKYFNYIVEMVKPRTLLIVDNVVRDGKIVDEIASREDPRVIGARGLMEGIRHYESLRDVTVLQTVAGKGYDGFLMALVN